MKFNSTPLCFGIAASLMVMAAVEAQPPASRSGYVETPLGPRAAGSPLSDMEQLLANVQYLKELNNVEAAMNRGENDVSLGALLNAYDARRGVSGNPDETPEQFHQRLGRPNVRPTHPDSAQPPFKQSPTLNEQLYSASTAVNLDQLQQLIQQGANVNYQHPKSGETALHQVAFQYWENPQQVQDAMGILVNAGAHVNTQNNQGQTPLYLASFYKNKAAAEFVLAHGADPQIPDKWGKTPLDRTQDPQHPLHALLRSSPQPSHPMQPSQPVQPSDPSEPVHPSHPMQHFQPTGFQGCFPSLGGLFRCRR